MGKSLGATNSEACETTITRNNNKKSNEMMMIMKNISGKKNLQNVSNDNYDMPKNNPATLATGYRTQCINDKSSEQ